MRKSLLVAALAVITSVLASAQAPQKAGTREPQRELKTSIGDGFTITAVGDCINVLPVSQTPNFALVGRLIRGTDVAIGNFEGTTLDVRRLQLPVQAVTGGGPLLLSPAVAKDLKTIGFDLMSRANNHVTDFGIEGMRATSQVLDEAGIVYAGVGETRAAARAARFFETKQGRVALISIASSFTPLEPSGPPIGEVPGRPGINALRTTSYALITAEEMRTLKKIRDELPNVWGDPLDKEPADELELLGAHYKIGSPYGFAFSMNPIDEREILASVRDAKERSDFVIVTIHAHNPGNWSQEPADFLPKLAHAVIDAGADDFIGTGPHQLRGIEVYKGHPIFYSLGNFIFQTDLLEANGSEMFEREKMDPATTTEADLDLSVNAKHYANDNFYQSIIATTRFERGSVAEIRLTPIDLAYASRGADRGVPSIASTVVAHTILERLQKLSTPFGTHVEIVGSVGIIRPPDEPAH